MPRTESCRSEGSHPRGWGSTARILGHYVREEKVLRLEEAIRKMTSFAAEAAGLPDRGLVKVGFPADLAVFDPEHVRDRSTFTEPNQYSEGFRYVAVNGVLVVDDGQDDGQDAGKGAARTRATPPEDRGSRLIRHRSDRTSFARQFVPPDAPRGSLCRTARTRSIACFSMCAIASSTESVKRKRSRSSRLIVPTCDHLVAGTRRAASSSPCRSDTTGKPSIFFVWIRVTASKSSSIVPTPPGITTNAYEYLTSITLRTKK